LRGKRIAAVLLAAGESSRMGQPKQLLQWRGRPLIEHAARTAVEAGLRPVVVVIGSRADDMRAAIRSPVTIVENARWAEGMSTSLQAGLQALPDDVDAAIMLLVDQPRIGAGHLRAVIEAYRESGMPIVGSAFQGRRASPTLFDRSLFADLMRIVGDEGGRSIVRANPQRLFLVEAGDALTLQDIDSIEDWQQMTTDE
jgi:molybdenum cofactor cytidylyltransferase